MKMLWPGCTSSLWVSSPYLGWKNTAALLKLTWHPKTDPLEEEIPNLENSSTHSTIKLQMLKTTNLKSLVFPPVLHRWGKVEALLSVVISGFRGLFVGKRSASVSDVPPAHGMSMPHLTARSLNLKNHPDWKQENHPKKPSTLHYSGQMIVVHQPKVPKKYGKIEVQNSCFRSRANLTRWKCVPAVIPLTTNMSSENKWLEDVFPTDIVPF